MRGEDVREVFEAVLPEEALSALIEGSGLQKRVRKLDAVKFVRAAVIASARGGAGRQASIVDAYFQAGGAKVARSASYSWFSEAFEQTMADVAERAMACARSLPVDLPGFLGRHVSDWHAFDSSTVRLDDDLLHAFPGTGKYAALKIHKRFSIGVGATVGYTISPAREHDARHLTLDESWRGLGLLADLGYASFQLLRDAKRFGVRYVIRLKESWKPKVQRIAAGEVSRTFVPGADFDTLLDEETLCLSGPAIDADVRLGRGDDAVPARLVGVRHDGLYRYYLTNLPRDVTPEQVTTLYRVRWEIELDNKLNKSGFSMDEIRSRTAHTACALIHASIAASNLACILAHKHRLLEHRPTKRRKVRTTPPIHVQTLARIMAAGAERIAATMAMEPDAAASEWDDIAATFVHVGVDPNWRRRPSILDELRGWIIRPAPSRGGGRKKRQPTK